MKTVINLLLFFLCIQIGYSQQSTENLKKEQKKLEKKITQTKTLLNKVQSSSKSSLNEVRLLDNQIKSREALVRVYNNQIRMAEMKMIQKKNDVSRLHRKLQQLKTQYKKMLLFAYKKRSNTDRLMFILSARSYNEALKRNSYLKKVADLQRRQSDLIQKHQELIRKEITEIGEEKDKKQTVMNVKKEEKDKIEEDKKIKEKSYSKLKKEEAKLMTQLKEDEKKRKRIESQVQAAIKEELRKEEERRRQREKESEKPVVSKSPDKPKTGGDVVANEPKPTYKPQTISSEGAIVGKNFEANKGNLPTPVTGGSITSKYGRNAHPAFKDVYENNNGIDITCAAGSKVRAVFEGEVSSVFSISGAGKVVIIKHGNYRTVYSNLSNVSVHVGNKISAKQNIGSLLIEDGSSSVLHFEIHSVSGINTTPLNPSLWLRH